jgi:hypothetical protein
MGHFLHYAQFGISDAKWGQHHPKRVQNDYIIAVYSGFHLNIWVYLVVYTFYVNYECMNCSDYFIPWPYV